MDSHPPHEGSRSGVSGRVQASIAAWRPRGAAATLTTGACALVLGCAALFAYLQVWNQSQTEGLIFYDFWRSYQNLAGPRDPYRFFYHNVHTYILSSALWYSDVVLAAGTLRASHAYVVCVTTGAFFCAVATWHARGADPVRRAVAFALLLSAALWLSPSNAAIFAYPLLDTIACTLLFSLVLASAMLHRIGTQEHTRARTARLAYVTFVSIGFLTLEPFLAIPVVLALEALLRGRRREAWFQLTIVCCWSAMYLGFMRSWQVASVPEPRRVAIALGNFLTILSSHVGLLLQSFGMPPRGSARASQVISLVQLTALFLLLARTYRSARREAWYPLPLLLAVFALTTNLLATWLRYATATLHEPVVRYTPYTTMLSMALCLLAGRTLTQRGDKLLRITAAGTLALGFTYVVAEAAALITREHNAARPLLDAHLAMSLYAQSPSAARGLGPADVDEGAQMRGSLYGFLKDAQLAVFSMEPYGALGKHFRVPGDSGGPRCRVLASGYTGLSTPESGYLTLTLEVALGAGNFFVLSPTGRVEAFSFALRATPFSRIAMALVPAGALGQGVYYGEPDAAGQADLARCH